jgi:hypothetical protein
MTFSGFLILTALLLATHAPGKDGLPNDDLGKLKGRGQPYRW